MRKISMNLLALLCVLFACQGVNAQNVIFQEDFVKGLGDFTIEGFNGPNNNIWAYDAYAQCAAADGYGKFDVGETAEVYLVSPAITLTKGNKITFSSRTMFFSDIENEIGVCIRENGTKDWVGIQVTIPNNSNASEPLNVGDFNVPAEFAEKTVQFAFKYTSKQSNTSGIWNVKSFIVKEGSGDEPVEKADPQISYSVGDVEAFLGQSFEAPVLNNPNSVEILYSSNKPEVAEVNPITGEVTLVAEGFTTITATSIENDQFKSAAVNYVLTVKSANESEILFEQSFETEMGEFMVEGPNGTESNPIWRLVNGAVKADGYGKIDEASTSYLVSPEITLGASGNKAEFFYYFSNYGETPIEEQIGLSIRENGGEWVSLEVPVCEASNGYISSGNIIIPSEYAGKKVQVALKYFMESGSAAGIWGINQIVIKKDAAPAPVEKKDPELSFAEESYDFYFNTGSFKGVALNNPYNVEVVYKIIGNDYSVCDVDPYTGEVYLYNYGTAVITAESEENDEFKAGSASYTLNVTDVPTSIEGVNMDTLEKGKIYDLQGRRVNKLAKGVYVVNGKKVIIK